MLRRKTLVYIYFIYYFIFFTALIVNFINTLFLRKLYNIYSGAKLLEATKDHSRSVKDTRTDISHILIVMILPLYSQYLMVKFIHQLFFVSTKVIVFRRYKLFVKNNFTDYLLLQYENIYSLNKCAFFIKLWE